MQIHFRWPLETSHVCFCSLTTIEMTRNDTSRMDLAAYTACILLATYELLRLHFECDEAIQSGMKICTIFSLSGRGHRRGEPTHRSSDTTLYTLHMLRFFSVRTPLEVVDPKEKTLIVIECCFVILHCALLVCVLRSHRLHSIITQLQ